MKLKAFNFRGYSNRVIVQFPDECLLREIEFIHYPDPDDKSLMVTLFDQFDSKVNPGLKSASDVLLDGLQVLLTKDQSLRSEFSFINPSLPLGVILKSHMPFDAIHAHSLQFSDDTEIIHGQFPHTHIEYQSVTNFYEYIQLFLQMLVKLDHSLKNNSKERERFYRYCFHARFEKAIHPDYSPLDTNHTLQTCVDHFSGEEDEAAIGKAALALLETSFEPRLCDVQESELLPLVNGIEVTIIEDTEKNKQEAERRQKWKKQKEMVQGAAFKVVGAASIAFFATKVVNYTTGSEFTCTLQ